MFIQEKIVIKSKHLFFFQLYWKPYFLFTPTQKPAVMKIQWVFLLHIKKPLHPMEMDTTLL
ncbi:hypothetical protein CON09_19925 [Bacillus anthracis]|nr:hypothetical protein [Bacillus cereus]PDY89319.1 hypothetical protein CON09_19925 [Bacillus anthracis]